MNDLSATAAPSRASGARSARMVEFLLSLKLENLPADLIREARTRLLDGLGCGLDGRATPWGRDFRGGGVRGAVAGAATICGNREPVAAARAALVNGTATHGIVARRHIAGRARGIRGGGHSRRARDR